VDWRATKTWGATLGICAKSKREVDIVAISWPLQKNGSAGEPVRTVQYLLRAHGEIVTVDGRFGPITQSKVEAFQKAHGLSADGIVGNHTWPALVITIQQGSTGEAVRAVQDQARFRNLSGVPGRGLAVDGIFGPKTDAWVQGFQQALHAGDPSIAVDGIVGPVTWSNLVNEALSG
jgi:peptidoglycan hydrolase-like protein with peptidoglycan-binding domain